MLVFFGIFFVDFKKQREVVVFIKNLFLLLILIKAVIEICSCSFLSVILLRYSLECCLVITSMFVAMRTLWLQSFTACTV